MNLSEYVKYDATELARLVAQGEITPKDLANLARSGAEQTGEQLNAVIEIFKDQCETPEFTLDCAFSGVPFLVKDLVLQIKGRLNELGSRLAAGRIASDDTDLMKRFRASGVVTLGRTTAPEFGFCTTTEPLQTGKTRNPWDTERTTGGSSGGSAAAVAAGIVPIAHGNDGGGSIRIPAACCGVVGLKPTRGRVPIGPEVGEGLHGCGVEFIMSRSVRDTAAMLDAVSGPAPGDPYQIVAPVRPYTEELNGSDKPFRIAYTTTAWSGIPVDPEYTAATESIAKELETLGHFVMEDSPQFDYEAFVLANARIWSVNTTTWADGIAAQMDRSIDSTTLEGTTLACYEFGKTISAVELEQARAIYNSTCRHIAPFFEKYDVLLTPTIAKKPVAMGEIDSNRSDIDAVEWQHEIFSRFCPFTALFNVTGQPGISLPLCESTDGLPIGMQLVARFGDEATLLRLASQLEKHMPWIQRRPRIHVASA